MDPASHEDQQREATQARAWLTDQRRLGSVVGAILAVIAGAFFCNELLWGRLFYLSYDLPLLLRGAAPPKDIAIIYMDEDSREDLHQDWDKPWDRNLHARLLNRLKAEGARTVVFDVVFSKPTNERNVSDPLTDELAKAITSYGRVVIASHIRNVGKKGMTEGKSIETPEEMLDRNAAGVGSPEVVADLDMVVRRLFLQIPKGDGTSSPTLAAEAARLEGCKLETSDGLSKACLNYYGRPGSIESKSYYDALKGEIVPAGFFSNKVVIVGESYGVAVNARIDTFRSPFDSYGHGPWFPGAELHATAIANLLHNDWLKRSSALAEFAVFLLFGVLAGSALPRLSPLRATALAVTIMAALTLVAFELEWRGRVWFPWMIPVVVQIPVALGWAILWRAIKAQMESRFLEHSLSLYLSPKAVQAMLRHPELLKPGGTQKRISILGSDIANFSKISSRMDAEDTLALLNQYYEEAISCIHATDGTIIELIGDAIFAVWNAPQEQDDHQARASRAAVMLHEKVIQFNRRPDCPPLITTLGLHTGEACVGNMGGSSHYDYTAVGQAVNLAFRLQGLNKQLGTAILASRDFLKGNNELLSTRMIGHFRFKGFDHVVEVYEILGSAQKNGPGPPWVEMFARGVHHFRRREFADGEKAFRETLAVRPDDGPSQFLLERTLELSSASVGSDWAGEIELDQK